MWKLMAGTKLTKKKHRHILRHKQHRINTLDAIVTFMDIMEFKIKDLRYRKKSYVHICCTNVDNLHKLCRMHVIKTVLVYEMFLPTSQS